MKKINVCHHISLFFAIMEDIELSVLSSLCQYTDDCICYHKIWPGGQLWINGEIKSLGNFTIYQFYKDPILEL